MGGGGRRDTERKGKGSIERREKDWVRIGQGRRERRDKEGMRKKKK